MLWWSIATAELRRGWLIKRRYPLDLLFSFAGGIVFLVTVAAGVMMVVGGRVSLDPSWAPRVWGLVLASVASSALGGGIGYVNYHTATGTMEQVALSPVSLPSLIVLRQTMSFIVSVPYLAAYAAGLLWLFPGFRSPFVLGASVLVTYFGMMGLGFVVSGLALIYQQVQSVLGFVTMALYPAPLLLSANALAASVWAIFPYGLGLQLAAGDFSNAPLMPIVVTVWLAAGHAFLRWADQKARHRGVLGQY